MVASMALDSEPRSLMTRLRSGAVELSGAVVAVVGAVAVGSLLLMAVGLVVRGLSVAVGAPLPYVHDDPNRIEWGGLAELVGYGLAGALTLYALYAFAQRALPAAPRGYIGRVIGAATLLLLAASGAWVAIDDWDLQASGFALVCGYGAYRVARGLPLDDEDERASGGSTHHAS
jgi:hypothetical protein